MPILQAGITTLLNTLPEIGGQTVTLARGATTSTWSAMKGKAELNIDRLTSVSLEGIDASFIGDAEDYMSGSEPLRGDRITDASGDVWEVVPFESFGCYRNTLGMLRVFVKAVA